MKVKVDKRKQLSAVERAEIEGIRLEHPGVAEAMDRAFLAGLKKGLLELQAANRRQLRIITEAQKKLVELGRAKMPAAV